MQEYVFNDEQSFVGKLKEILASGTPGNRIETFTPVPIHGIDDMLGKKPTKVRVYAVLGALTGATLGFFLTIYSILKYPVFVSAKPLVSILPFCVIAFELTILIGALSSFVGFLALARLPNIIRLMNPLDYGNQFAIVVHSDPQNNRE